MRPPSNLGRVAGIWYLLLIAIGPFFLIYVPGKLYVKGNAAATIANIAAHERLFRFGILAELIGGIILIFLVLAFYRLFRDVDPYLAMLLIILGGVMPAVIYFVNAAYELEVLMLARGADFFSVLDNPQRNALGHGVRAPAQFSNRCLATPCGRLALPIGDAGLSIAFSAPLPGRMAWHRRHRLVKLELCGDPSAGIPK